MTTRPWRVRLGGAAAIALLGPGLLAEPLDEPRPAFPYARGIVCQGDELEIDLRTGKCTFPIAGAEVVLRNSEGVEAVARTDDRGQYELPALPLLGLAADTIRFGADGRQGLVVTGLRQDVPPPPPARVRAVIRLPRASPACRKP